jgi:hypothetical protein
MRDEIVSLAPNPAMVAYLHTLYWVVGIPDARVTGQFKCAPNRFIHAAK